MCGHVGVAGKLEHKDEHLMKRLLLFDYFRGPDSTGLAAIRSNGDAKIAKIASHPLDLFDTKKFADALNGYQSRAFIGHNRLATKGGVSTVNAHPYHYDHIVGAHNGTLDVSSWKALEEALDEKTDVDSQAVFMHIAKFGVEATLPLMQGAWALVWFDQAEGTLNFLRNGQRPFWYAYSEDFSHVFWASEWRTLDDAIFGTQANNVTQHKLHKDEGGFRYYQTQENWLYRFDLSKMVVAGAERPKPRVIELKGKEPTPVQTNAAVGSGNFPRPQTQTWTPPTTLGNSGSSTNQSGAANTASHKSVKDVIHLHGNTKRPLGGYLSEEQFKEMAKYGCSWCQADVEFEEVGVLVMERDNIVLCPSCAPTDTNQSTIYASDFEAVSA